MCLSGPSQDCHRDRRATAWRDRNFLLVRCAALTVAITLAGCQKTPPGEGQNTGGVASTQATAADWFALYAQVGKYPSAIHLFDQSPVSGPLQALLGMRMAELKTDFQVETPLGQEGDILYTSGNKAHEGGVNAAYLLVNPKTKSLEVGIWAKGGLSVTRNSGPVMEKPKDIQALIASNNPPDE